MILGLRLALRAGAAGLVVHPDAAALARPRSWRFRAWRGNPTSYRDILGVSELIFSSPTTLLEEAWSNSKKMYNKNFKVEILHFWNLEMKFMRNKDEISYNAKIVQAPIDLNEITPLNLQISILNFFFENLNSNCFLDPQHGHHPHLLDLALHHGLALAVVNFFENFFFNMV